jgi:cytochrome bd-type quinol oxidase subunit 1
MAMPTMKTHGRLAAFGALGVCAGCVALFALVFWVAAPTPTTGIDFEHALITRLSVGVIVAAMIGAHYAFARQLLAYVREHGS